jgi:diketogulonate reductase-like aldo/keto reductase
MAADDDIRESLTTRRARITSDRAGLHGYEKTAGQLGVDQIDLLIPHQALPSAFDRTVGAYRPWRRCSSRGRCAIRVSNFMVEHRSRKPEVK